MKSDLGWPGPDGRAAHHNPSSGAANGERRLWEAGQPGQLRAGQPPQYLSLPSSSSGRCTEDDSKSKPKVLTPTSQAGSKSWYLPGPTAQLDFQDTSFLPDLFLQPLPAPLQLKPLYSVEPLPGLHPNFEFCPFIRAQQQPLLSPPPGSFLNHAPQESVTPFAILLTFLSIPPGPPSQAWVIFVYEDGFSPFTEATDT